MSSALIYKMRLTAPNKPGTASHNSNYVKYIAEREHVMKLSPESESGLFGRIDGTNNDELDVTDTQNYVYGISKAGVTVYNAYISFRPEIAKRLELDSLEKWQNYIKFHIETLMRGYDINNNESVFKNVTKETEKIYKQLAAPFQTLENLRWSEDD